MSKEKAEQLETKIPAFKEKIHAAIQSQKYEHATDLKDGLNNLFKELESITSSEYLKEKWGVKKDKDNTYTTML